MREIAEAVGYTFIPVTLACGLAFAVAYYGAGKCLKVAGAFLWSLGEGLEVGMSAGKAAGKETFTRTMEAVR